VNGKVIPMTLAPCCVVTDSSAPNIRCMFDIYFSPLMSATSTLPVADSVM
jgi:hypothetical protein